MDFHTASLMGRVLVAHERDIAEQKAQNEVDFLITDEELKDQIWWCLDGKGKGKGSGKAKKMAALDLVLKNLNDSEVSGSRRLLGTSDRTLEESVLKFRPKHNEPRPGWTWKFTLSLSFTATGPVRDAFADLAATGGSDKVQIRRPLQQLGPLVQEVAETFGIPGNKGKDSGGKGKGSGKGKDWHAKGKDKGRPAKGKDRKGKSQDQGKGPGKDAWGGAAFPAAPRPGAARSAAESESLAQSAAELELLLTTSPSRPLLRSAAELASMAKAARPPPLLTRPRRPR